MPRRHLRNQSREGRSPFLQLFLLHPLSPSCRSWKPTGVRVRCDKRPPVSLKEVAGCGRLDRGTYTLFPKSSEAGAPRGGRDFLGVSSRRVCRIVTSAPRVRFLTCCGHCTVLAFQSPVCCYSQPRIIQSLSRGGQSGKQASCYVQRAVYSETSLSGSHARSVL